MVLQERIELSTSPLPRMRHSICSLCVLYLHPVSSCFGEVHFSQSEPYRNQGERQRLLTASLWFQFRPVFYLFELIGLIAPYPAANED